MSQVQRSPARPVLERALDVPQSAFEKVLSGEPQLVVVSLVRLLKQVVRSHSALRQREAPHA